jgi:hypothetical protein
MAAVAMVVGLGVGVAAPSQADSSVITACTKPAGGGGLKYDLSGGACTGKTTLQLQWPTESAFDGVSGQVTTDTSELSTIQSKQATDESDIATNSSAITGIQSQQTTDEANITANSSAISTIQSKQTTDEANIAANSSAISTIQSKQATDEANIAANSSAIAGNTAAISSLQSQPSDEVSAFSTTPGGNVTMQGSPIVVASLEITTPSTTDTENLIVTFSATSTSDGSGSPTCILYVNNNEIDALATGSGGPATIAPSMTAGTTVAPGAANNVSVQCSNPYSGTDVLEYISLTATITPGQNN